MVAVTRDACSADVRVPDEIPSIQAAIDTVTDGDRILVEPGVYFENLDFLGKAIQVLGVAGRDETTIDGGHSGSVVVFQNGEGPDTALEGFTLTNGSGTHVRGVGTFGGGILCVASSPIIRMNRIVGNTADFGGGVALRSGSAAQLLENSIVENHADLPYQGLGGGLYSSGFATPLIRGNRILSNSAFLHGGGIACIDQSSPLIEKNVIVDNAVSETQGKASGLFCTQCVSAEILKNLIASTRGIVLLVECSDLTLEANEITDSTFFTGVEARACSDLRITRNRIARNSSNFTGAGGLLLVDCTGIVDRNSICDNNGAPNGGGIYLHECELLFVSNLVSGNHAPNRGAAMDVTGTNNHIDIINCTFSRNRGNREALRLDGTSIHNSILWGNETLAQVDGALSVDSSCIEGGWTGDGSGNFDADPLFVDAPQGDFHLRIGSPCVDRGDSSLEELDRFPLDLDGDGRVLNGDRGPQVLVDVGADELAPEVAARYGTVNSAGGSLFDALRINGASGDHVLSK